MAIGYVAVLAMAAGCAGGMGRGAGGGDKAGFAAFVKQSKLPVAEVPVVSAPALDGDMDGVYAKATPLSFVFLDGSPGAPKAKTTAYVVSTADTLFVFVKCDTAKPDQLKMGTTAGDDIWHDDYVEMFLAPSTNRAGTFLQFATNPIGTICDGKVSEDGADSSWTSKVKVKAKVTKTGWTAEFAIPFADLGVQPGKVNKVWVANFGRFAQAEGEDVAWCPTGQRESFGPTKFGFLWLEAGTVDNAK
jgi:hypothetical protein